MRRSHQANAKSTKQSADYTIVSMYQIIVIDPPWPKKKGGLRRIRPNQTRDLAYETMPVNEMFTLLDQDVFPKADAMHCVFLWTVDEFLFECEQQMLIRGYKRHCRMIWDKTNGIAPAFTVRFAHEYLIWFYKPKLLPIAKAQRGVFKTVFQEKAREHSRKPDCVYQMIEALYPDARKYDVFSRQKRRGWKQYGNQKNFFPSQEWK